MLRKLILIVLLVPLLIVLTGCFQPAGEAFEPINTTAPAESLSNPQDTQPDQTSPTSDLNSIPVSPTLGVAITIISPTRVAPSSTPEPIQPDALETVSGDAVPTQPQFVTPGGPLGPVTPEISTPAFDALPSTTPSGLITPTAFQDAVSADGCTYTVQGGDTLYRIALRNNTTVSELRTANQLSGDLIQPGQVLQIPNCGVDSASAPVEGVTPDASVDSGVLPAGGETYTVQPGDTLFTIAQRFGTTISAITAANNLANPNQLSVGQELIIPPPSG